jgi:predicted metal-dependent hydrolase
MSNQGVLTYGDRRIPYLIEVDPDRSKRVAIHVEPDGRVIVEAPPEADKPSIHSAVVKRARWIATHVAAAEDRQRHMIAREYVSGEQVLYLGRRYVLKVTQSDQGSPSVRLKGNRLEVTRKDTTRDAVRAAVRAWYRVHARNFFDRRIGELSASLPWVKERPPFRLLEMSRQWGSCSPKGEIILNPHLIKAPRPCVDYVLVHEMAHLKHHDHSPEFFALLRQEVPEWHSVKCQLDGLVELLFNN